MERCERFDVDVACVRMMGCMTGELWRRWVVDASAGSEGIGDVVGVLKVDFMEWEGG